MSDTNLQLLAGSLPGGSAYCFTTWQQVYQDMFRLGRAVIPGNLTAINFGNTTPAANLRDRPWFRTNSNGTPDRWYVYWNGAWISPHPITATPAGVTVYFTTLWTGAIADISGIDLPANNTDPVSDTTGPFWQEVTALQARFPIGYGTLPSTTVVTVGSTGGEENHTLTTPELPVTPISSGIVTLQVGVRSQGGSTANTLVPSPESGATEPTLNVPVTGSTFGGGLPHNNMPPYYGVAFIRRTARKFYAL